MKKLIIALFMAVTLPAFAQTNTPPPIDSEPWYKFLDFLSHSSNLIVAPYGIYDSGTKSAGGGIALAYKVSDYVLPTLRVDVIDKDVWMPSGSLQLQYPIPMGKFTFIPFGFGGLATPLSGRGSDNGTAVGIIGLGADLKLSDHWGILGDVERWSGFNGYQFRGGFHYKF